MVNAVGAVLTALWGASSRRELYHRVAPAGWEECVLANEQRINVNLPLRQKEGGAEAIQGAAVAAATPGSSSYGHFLTKEDVDELVRPSMHTQSIIREWLSDCNVSHVDASGVDRWTFNAGATQLECLFGGALHECRHAGDERKHLAMLGSISIPTHIQREVDFIPGISDFPRPKTPRRRRNWWNVGSGLDKGVVSPKVLAALYNIPGSWYPAKGATLLVAELDIGQGASSYTPAYLFGGSKEPGFFKLAGVSENEATGATTVGPFKSDDGELEANLDMQFAASTARGAELVYWTEERWMYELASGIHSGKDGVSGASVDVVSISFAWSEQHQCIQPTGAANPTCSDLKVTTPEYVSRTNTEFAKLGAQGVTVVVSSGDDGAPGNFGKCDGKLLDPLYPAASPYVLTIGGTALSGSGFRSQSSDPICSDNKGCATSKTEIACTYPQAQITSGGGFSAYSTRPTWQSAEVEQYLKEASLPSAAFNKSNRAFPDISLAAHNYAVYMGSLDMTPEDRFWIPTDGTSCAAPVAAGIFTLLRSQLGRRLGMAAPSLYQIAATHPGVFRDITSGNNKCKSDCCGGAGYNAAKGWDPVTGLGSIDAEALFKALSGAPPAPTPSTPHPPP
eukprot:Hpha_TRINITY_DN11343_c0_g1::TRINITY_DN11343_c0_g1_i1::g.63159::m.63159/K01279/TPP1, CLN2; tripeptidyl-peptidase I